jgi:hypothetical protein
MVKKKRSNQLLTTSLLVNVSFEDANEKSNVVLTTVTRSKLEYYQTDLKKTTLV